MLWQSVTSNDRKWGENRGKGKYRGFRIEHTLVGQVELFENKALSDLQ
jgi:hypothetical protein